MTLITFEDGKAVFRDGKAGTQQACCCEGGQCCCTGTSSITLGLDGTTPTGETCQEIQDVSSLEESCPSDTIAKPDPAESCGGGSVVVEWCELSVTLDCDVVGDGEQRAVRQSDNFPLDLPPYLCTVGSANITRIILAASFAANLTDPASVARSDCLFGCRSECNRCIIRFSFLLYDQPATGTAKTRKYYVTQRSGCDASPIIETVLDDGNYCCPEDAEITVTFAP